MGTEKEKPDSPLSKEMLKKIKLFSQNTLRVVNKGKKQIKHKPLPPFKPRDLGYKKRGEIVPSTLHRLPINKDLELQDEKQY